MPNEIVATKMEVVYQVDQRYNDDRKVQVFLADITVPINVEQKEPRDWESNQSAV